MNRIQQIQTPTGPLAVIRPIAERLLKEGVITGKLDGELKAHDAATLKAAVMAGGVCDFCSAVGVEHSFNVPDFEMPVGAGRSVGGWAACDSCAEMVRARNRKGLLRRALEGMAFPRFSKAAIEELHDKFWSHIDQAAEVMGVAVRVQEFIDDKLPEHVTPTLTDRDRRIEAIMRVSGLSRGEMHTLLTTELNELTPEVLLKLSKWRKNFGKIDAQKLADLLNPGRKPLPNIVPHWHRAVDAKFEVIGTLRKYMKADEHSEMFPDPTDLGNTEALRNVLRMASARQEFRNLGFTEDLKLLPGAQVYSFNAETAAAIMEASKSIPHDAPLSSIETPNTGAGWFWFSEPLSVAASPVASDFTYALLWGWVNYQDGPAIMFSAYVLDEKDKGSAMTGDLLPSTRFYWPLALSFHDMLAFNTTSWRATYGPGTPLANDPMIISEANTIKVIADLSLFFVMACLWFKQTVSTASILTKEKGHVERHLRRRLKREYKLDEEPTVQVVALRKSARVPSEDAPAERVAGAREYHCRWIVQGHPRLQPVGPGRKERKLIWIEAHPAGPEDKPLRTKTKVFAVVR